MGSKNILGLLRNLNYFELSEFGALGLSFECNLFELKSKGPVIIYRLGGVGVFRGGSHGFLKTFRGDQP